MMIGEVIAEIQSLGVRVPARGLERKGGAGPAEAGFLLLEGRPVSVPANSPYVADSPYSVEWEEGGIALLTKEGKGVFPVEFVKEPRFQSCSTEEGIPCGKIALLHGNDCLATTVIQTCIYWDSDARCRFCGIQLSLANQQTLKVKTPGQVAEVALKARELDSVRHVVLTTGTAAPAGGEITHVARCASAVKRATGLPVHAQIMPPPFPERLGLLKEAGVDTVGIHVESLDKGVLSRIAPAKAAIGLKRYREAWRTAVEIFGPNQVSSFLIAGLGESRDSLVMGSEILADLGVYPFVVPLRPIPGSLMEDMLPPDAMLMKRVYRDVADVLKRKGLSAYRCLAGCVRCGACSALPAYEQPFENVICHTARTHAQLRKALAIRNQVFVQEQKLFPGSDEDENDRSSIHLVAEEGDEVVGTVRVFRADNGNGHWIGGRLAVAKGHRSSGAGEVLVQNAVRYVKGQGCTQFTAQVQEENVSFFSRLGWRKVGSIHSHFGRLHQMMEADLS
jgi:radical SAM protein (TIGR04043 family)/putative N-acetyltransferase (TIGR04045 family)